MRVGVYTYEYLGVHIRDSGCTQKSMYLMNILVYSYFIFTFCHTRAQLIITAHLISISDDKLGPRSGIIISMEPAGRPTDLPLE